MYEQYGILVEHALPFVGQRVILNPEGRVFEHLNPTYATMDAHIISEGGDEDDIRGVCKDAKKGRSIGSWNITIQFKDGTKEGVRLRDLLPIDGEFEEYVRIHARMSSKTVKKEEMDTVLDDILIRKGKKVDKITYYNRERMEKILSQL